jgi:hypothetical protein
MLRIEPSIDNLPEPGNATAMVTPGRDFDMLFVEVLN